MTRAKRIANRQIADSRGGISPRKTLKARKGNGTYEAYRANGGVKVWRRGSGYHGALTERVRASPVAPEATTMP